MANCSDKSIEVVSDDYQDHRECLSGCPSNAPYYILAEKRCISNCPTATPYYIAQTAECIDECPSNARYYIRETLECISECPRSKPYYVIATLECIASCPTATPYYLEETLECVVDCPAATPYYIAEALMCRADCPVTTPYYDVSKLSCVAACTGELPYYPDPAGSDIRCTGCQNGVVFENVTTNIKYCLARCPDGYINQDGVCSDGNNQQGGGWWIWAAVAVGVLLLIILIAILAIVLKKKRNQGAKGGTDTRGTNYYSRNIENRMSAGPARNMRQTRRPVVDTRRPQTYERFARVNAAPRRGIVSGYRTDMSTSGSQRRNSITNLSRSTRQS